jgi:hypothetical protein
VTIRAFRHLETTVATVHTCQRCRTPVLFGLAEGLPARAEFRPLDTLRDEPRVVLAGLQTYTLTRTGLVHRDAGRRSDPTLTGPVLAEHDCRRSRS